MDAELTNILSTAGSQIDGLLVARDDQIAALQLRLDAAASISVFDALETEPWLVAGGTAANAPGGTATMTPSQAQPGVTSAFLGIKPNGAFANGYFYKHLGAAPAKTRFVYELSFLFGTAADSAASQAVELDIQQVIGNVVYNMGWQFDFAQNLLRVWNRSGKAWVATGLPCPRWTPGQWMRIVAEQHRDSSQVVHDSITINGTLAKINMTFPAPTITLPDMLNCAVQLDGNKAGTAYKLYLDRVRFSASQ